MLSYRRGALVAGTALAMAFLEWPVTHAASLRPTDDPLDRPTTTDGAARDTTAVTPGVQGHLGGFNWSASGPTKDADGSRTGGQDFSLDYQDSDVTIRGKWDKQYKASGGMTFGATLDEAHETAIGGGFLANQRNSEYYGQYQFIASDLDPQSAFTLGEYARRENRFFDGGGAQVWSYTTYLDWFKRNDGRQSVDANLPPALRDNLQVLLNNVSALSGTLAYTYAPIVHRDDEGSPQTNAIDLSLRAVTPSLFGQYLPVSFGGGGNFSHYNHVDGTTQKQLIGNGGAGIAFLGADYFNHPVHWLVGVGADANTHDVVGGTAAAELGSISVSYRQTSDHQQRLLFSWCVSDLMSGADRQRASTLAVAEGHAPLVVTADNSRASLPDRFGNAEQALSRLGFMPPTGAEVSRPSPNERGAVPTMHLSSTSAALQPQQVVAAITRTHDIVQHVSSTKNTAIQQAKAAAKGTITATVTALGSPAHKNSGFVAVATIAFNAAMASAPTIVIEDTDNGNAVVASRVTVSGNTYTVEIDTTMATGYAPNDNFQVRVLTVPNGTNGLVPTGIAVGQILDSGLMGN